MKIVIGADHRGFDAKEKIQILLTEQGHEVIDMGANSTRSCDYTDVGFTTAKAIAAGQADTGILLCGTGIGMSIASNKVRGVRAALCNDELTAQLARRHNNANVLCLAADLLGEELMRRVVEVWLETEFEGGRHMRRINKIAMIEQGQNPAEMAEE